MKSREGAELVVGGSRLGAYSWIGERRSERGGGASRSEAI